MRMIKDKINIRIAKRSDSQEIGAMAKDFANYLRNLGDKTKFQFNAKKFLRDGFGQKRAFNGLVAETDGKLVGYLLYHGGYDTDKGVKIFYIADLYVRPEYRRQGVGRSLIKELKKISKKTEVKKLFWQVFAHNFDARKFYWHIGARYRRDILEMKLPVK
jgi:ribosomal protein S18 acetylase RimI-like enzyme